MKDKIFINRRTGDERRESDDPRQNPRLDLAYRRRRKADERRQTEGLLEDYTAMVGECALETRKGESTAPH